MYVLAGDGSAEKAEGTWLRVIQCAWSRSQVESCLDSTKITKCDVHHVSAEEIPTQTILRVAVLKCVSGHLPWDIVWLQILDTLFKGIW